VTSILHRQRRERERESPRIKSELGEALGTKAYVTTFESNVSAMEGVHRCRPRALHKVRQFAG